MTEKHEPNEAPDATPAPEDTDPKPAAAPPEAASSPDEDTAEIPVADLEETPGADEPDAGEVAAPAGSSATEEAPPEEAPPAGEAEAAEAEDAPASDDTVEIPVAEATSSPDDTVEIPVARATPSPDDTVELRAVAETAPAEPQEAVEPAADVKPDEAPESAGQPSAGEAPAETPAETAAETSVEAPAATEAAPVGEAEQAEADTSEPTQPTPEESAAHGPPTEEALANAHLLGAAVEKLRGMQGRAFWDQVRTVRDMFNSLKPIHPDDRWDLWRVYRELVDKAKVERAEWKKQAEANLKELEEAIASLDASRHDPEKLRFSDFWKAAGLIRELFKSAKALRQADRRRLWNRFKTISNEVRHLQNDEMAGRKEHSGEIRAKVDAILAEADTVAETAGDEREFSRGRDLLAEAMDHMKGAGKKPEERMIRPDAKAVWDRYQAIREKMRERRKRLSADTVEALESRVNTIAEKAETENPFDVQASIKDVQAEMKMRVLDKRRREEFRRKLSEAWTTTSNRIEERRKEEGGDAGGRPRRDRRSGDGGEGRGREEKPSEPRDLESMIRALQKKFSGR